MFRLKNIVIAFLALFILIQFYQPAIEKKQVDSTTTFEVIYKMPQDLKRSLINSCYDCHSNTPIYPWYYYIQPMKFLVDYDIKEGKDDLNFSEFGLYLGRMKRNKLKSIVSQIKSDVMPLISYKLMHSNARLNKVEKDS